SEIGRLNSRGIINATQAYSFTDEAPVAGNNMYRIRQVDNDGTYTFSSVVAASFSATEVGRVLPNPTDGTLQIRLAVPSETSLTVSVLDLAGRKIKELSGITAGSVFSVVDLKPGVYLLRYSDGGAMVTQRFVRK
ncbi:MAG: T9SS type A sorting domain-containing protein, partial [Bacteroidota bacterium]